jgi:hydrogenase maturation protein HypF
MARIALEMCGMISRETGLKQVALSGGVFQNRLLLRLTVEHLERAGFKVLTHHLVPSNDGGISLGQAVIANFNRE